MVKMKKSNLKSVLMSILVGACVAFMSTLFEGLAEFLKSHSSQIVAGLSSSAVILARTFKV